MRITLNNRRIPLDGTSMQCKTDWRQQYYRLSNVRRCRMLLEAKNMDATQRELALPLVVVRRTARTAAVDRRHSTVCYWDPGLWLGKPRCCLAGFFRCRKMDRFIEPNVGHRDNNWSYTVFLIETHFYDADHLLIIKYPNVHMCPLWFTSSQIGT